MPRTVFCRANKRWVSKPTRSELLSYLLKRKSQKQILDRAEFSRLCWSLASKVAAGPFVQATLVRSVSDDYGFGFFRGHWLGGMSDRTLVAVAVGECIEEGRPYVDDFNAERERIRKRMLRHAEREWAQAHNAGIEIRRMERQLQEMLKSEKSENHGAT